MAKSKAFLILIIRNVNDIKHLKLQWFVVLFCLLSCVRVETKKAYVKKQSASYSSVLGAKYSYNQEKKKDCVEYSSGNLIFLVKYNLMSFKLKAYFLFS